ncbi:MAG: hypothetical protein E7270_00315 [Lachnospiraceae bacterium]|nr:hypothetical protein [Lachnospiraceae bacterium]
MRYVKPHYYDNFKCIADKCPSTCCAGWQIMIDEGALEKYSKEKDEFSHRLKNSIDWEEGAFFQNNGRCAMLNDNNLCDLVTAKGEEFLCKTCHLYPRHIEEFESVREFSLSLSCPVAANMILNEINKLTFLTQEDDLEEPLIDEFEDFDFFMHTQLEQAREVLFGIIQNRELSADERMAHIMTLAKEMQLCVDNGEIYKIEDIINTKPDVPPITPHHRYENATATYMLFNELEILDKNWLEIINELRHNLYDISFDNYSIIRDEFYQDFVCFLSIERWDIFKEQLLMFFVYTYFCGAVYDDCVYSKLALATFSVFFIEEIIISTWLSRHKQITFEDCVEISYRYAREVEHSDINLNTLEEIFMERFN